MDESWDDENASKMANQVRPAAPPTQGLGIGRGKPAPAAFADESAPSARWNGGGTSGGFNSFRNSNNNDENSNSSGGGGGFGARGGGSMGSRGGGRGGSSGGFGSGGSSGGFGFSGGSGGNSRACYNCNQTGHMSRECPEPRKDDGNRGGGGGGRGGFNSGGGDRGGFNSGGRGGSTVFRNSNNQNGDDNDNGGDSKPSFSGWRGSGGGGGGMTNGGGSDEQPKRTTFGDSSTRGGFGGGSGFRGGRGGGAFTSGDRNNTFGQSGNRSNDFSDSRGSRGGGGGGGGSSNCYNCNQPGHLSRDCPEPRKPREGGGGGGGGGGSFGGSRREGGPSDDIFDQPGGRGGLQTVERYVPPPPPTTQADIFGEALTKGENFGKYHRTQVRCTPEGKVKPIELYEEANLHTQVLSNIRLAHYEEPTAIQRYTLPCIRQQEDMMACAQTGSGKTAAFLLPIISNLLEYNADELTEDNHPPAPLCLILSPTRELALQTEREARKFAYMTNIKPCSAIGGHDMYAVSDRLREGCHILSATTGRLKDMVEKGRVSLKKVKYFVLDEADRMLDTGFEPDIRKIESLGLPSKDERHTSMFSATFPEEVQALAKHFLRRDYVFLAVGNLGGANEDIAQTIEEVPDANKKDRLIQLLEQNLRDQRCLIFVETKRHADYIGALLSQKKLISTTMHGDRTQKQRFEAVQQFTNGSCPILVATSVAARGLDFPLIGYVVNFHLPDTSDFYVHRIGRTGRAGHLGKSISFFDPDRESDRKIAPELIQKLSEAGQEVPEFLKRYAEGGSSGGFGRGGFGTRSTDMRSGGGGGGGHFQAAGASGGTASAGGANEDWD